MKPTFILSFDCEGKWGMADNINEFHQKMITNEQLNATYQKIVDLLEKRGIQATFAFVGAFTMSVDEYQTNKNWFKDKIYSAWLTNFQQDVARGQFDGWFNPRLVEIVSENKQHEIAAHGFTHIPLGETNLSREGFHQEMACLKNSRIFKDINRLTFVYPRNLVGYPDELEKYGIIGYRAGTTSAANIYGTYYRINRLLGEFNLNTKALNHAETNTIVSIPPGIILNWRYNLRKYIPIAISIARWRQIIKDAIKNNKVVHLYSHPHNFITGDSMFDFFDSILQLIQIEIFNKNIINLTQKEYVSQLMLNNQ